MYRYQYRYRLRGEVLFLILMTTFHCIFVYLIILVRRLEPYDHGERLKHTGRWSDELDFEGDDASYPDYLDRNFVDESDILSLTVSMISPKSLDWFKTKSMKFEVSLVVSHCDKHIGWIFDEYIPKDFKLKNVTIYTKCGNDVGGAPENSTIIQLPNVGRCDHTYAHHLEQLDTTALAKDHIVLFLKDNNYQVSVDAMSLAELLQTAYINGFACLKNWHPKENPTIKVCPSYSSYFLTTSLKKTVMPVAYNREERDKTDGFFSDYENLGHWLESLNLTLPGPLTQVCFGGQFATTSSQIEKHKSQWGNLKNGLSRGNNIEESHFAERTWAGLLSKRLSTKATMQLINRLKEVFIDKPIDQAGTLQLYCPERENARGRRKIHGPRGTGIVHRNKEKPPEKK